MLRTKHAMNFARRLRSERFLFTSSTMLLTGDWSGGDGTVESQDRARDDTDCACHRVSHAAPSVGNSSKESSNACTTRHPERAEYFGE